MRDLRMVFSEGSLQNICVLFGEMSRGHVQTASHLYRRFTTERGRVWTSCGSKRLKYSVNEGVGRPIFVVAVQ